MTANMTNRDAKGKFVKATLKVGDKVRAGSNPEIGIITEFLIGGRECRVRFDPPWNMCREVVQTLRKVEDAAPAELQPAPAPCPFKVGDRVECFDDRQCAAIRKGELGNIADLTINGILVNWDGHDFSQFVSNDWAADYLRKVDDAPAKPCRVDVDLLIYERDGLLNEVSRLKTEAKERANTYSQNVQSLKDELTSAHDATNIEHSALLEARKQLEDIAALRRSMAIFAITGSREGYGPFNSAIDAVLEGKVA